METPSKKPHDLVVQWTIVGIAGAAVIALGLVGFRDYFAAKQEARPFLTTAYLVFQLFTFESGAPDGPIPWSLNVARFAAPVVLAWAIVVGLIAAFRRRYSVLLLRFRSGHAVICGLGRKGRELAENFGRAGKTVVVLEKTAEEKSPLPAATTLLLEDAGEREALERARVWNAAQLVAVTGDDLTNLRIALLAEKISEEKRPRDRNNGWARVVLFIDKIVDKIKETILRKKAGNRQLDAYIHVVDRGLRMMASEHFQSREQGLRVRLINHYETSVRLLFDEYPLDNGDLKTPDDPRHPHLIVIGCGNMGEALVLQAAKVGHFINELQVEITVVDRKAKAVQDRLLGRYPQLDQVCRLAFLEGEAEGRGIQEQLKVKVAQDPKAIVTIAVCLDGDKRALSLAAQVRELFGSSGNSVGKPAEGHF